MGHVFLSLMLFILNIYSSYQLARLSSVDLADGCVKAFDTVKRKTLLEDLRYVVEPDELHLCKLLIEDVQFSIRVQNEMGELLNTDEDIKRRKILALDAMETMNNIWKSHLSEDIKIRIFNACTAPIFLSNSELWTTATATI